MNALGNQKGLKSFEQAKNIYLEPKSFQEKEIVTNTMKLQRHEAKLAFMEELKGMYSEGMLPMDKKKKWFLWFLIKSIKIMLEKW